MDTFVPAVCKHCIPADSQPVFLRGLRDFPPIRKDGIEPLPTNGHTHLDKETDGDNRQESHGEHGVGLGRVPVLIQRPDQGSDDHKIRGEHEAQVLLEQHQVYQHVQEQLEGQRPERDGRGDLLRQVGDVGEHDAHIDERRYGRPGSVHSHPIMDEPNHQSGLVRVAAAH